MKASLFYRAAAVLLALFAVSHVLGFSQGDPEWHADAVVAAMKSVQFDGLGSKLSYWNFFYALGVSVGLFYLFSAVLAWQLGGLSGEAARKMRPVAWAFAATYAAIVAISYLYLFIIPIAMSALITLCLAAGAWLAGKA